MPSASQIDTGKLQNGRDWGPAAPRPYLSWIGALALSFGYAVGWGSFVMPGTVFLPGAGPLGTVLGLVLGALAMLPVAWCYHAMARRCPGPGGPFSFVRKTFGEDHAFLVGWFLCLTYVAVLWANAASVVLLARITLGDAFQFGFHYTLEGSDVYFGEILLCLGLTAFAGAACIFSKRLAGRLQIAASALFAFGALFLFAVAAARRAGASAPLGPAFSPFSQRSPLLQVLSMVSMAPWAFVGFEAVVHSSGEFKFPARRTFGILVAALTVSVAVYVFLALLPVLAVPKGYSTWDEFLKASRGSAGKDSVPVFAAAQAILGRGGIGLVAAMMLCGQLTGIIASIVATSRLMHSMARDRLIPGRFALLDRDASPRNAILFVTLVSLPIPFLGRTVIGWPVDVSTIGATVAFWYVSAAAFKNGARAMGSVGCAMAVALGLLLLVPNYLAGSVLAPESYLLLASWCVLGFLFYRLLFVRDDENHFGHTTVAWIVFVVTTVFSSVMWIRQTTHSLVMNSAARAAATAGIPDTIIRETSRADSAMLRASIAELVMLLLTLGIMLSLFSILRAREIKMVEQRAKSEKINKARNFFFSTVSHDIRTPLNAIIGFSQMLKGGFADKAEHDRAVDAILVSGQTLLCLVNDILDLSKLESGRMNIEPEPTDCGRLVLDIVESFKAANKNHDVEIRAAVKDMPVLMVDPQRVRQVAFNLVGNATKFTKQGHIEVRSSFEPDKDNPRTGTFRFAVEDTGCGISEDDLKRLSTPYVQVGSKSSRNGGTGLGLAICRQLANAMGGDLVVRSTLGKGSVFTVIAPGTRVSDEPPVASGDLELPPQLLAAGSGTPPALAIQSNFRPRRILAADDEAMNRMVLKAMLGKIGDFDLTLASNGEEALAILKGPKTKPFDLVFSDLWMPKMDGEALVSEIRADPRLKDLPVYAVTADLEFRDKLPETGFTGMLLKPITFQSLSGLLG